MPLTAGMGFAAVGAFAATMAGRAAALRPSAVGTLAGGSGLADGKELA